MKRVERLEQYLLAQTEPVLMGDACEAIGATRSASANLIVAARAHLGDRLIETRREGCDIFNRTYAYFSIVGAGKSERRHLTIPRELWRGWRNPKTGITGARLGPDDLV